MFIQFAKRIIKLLFTSINAIVNCRAVVNNLNSALHIRLVILTVLFSIMFGVIAIRIIKVSTHSFQNLSLISKKAHKYRKEITDRNNNMLAVNLFAPTVVAYPQKIVHLQSVVDKLESIFTDINVDKLLLDLTSNRKFVIVKCHITPEQHKKIYDSGIVGIDFIEDYKRVYTYGNLLSHVLGYVSADMRGLAGIEHYFHDFLTDDTVQETDEQYSSNELVLSIDCSIQSIINDELDTAIREYNAIGGVGIVADVNNGEIIALVSKPDFNPHYPGKAINNQLFNKASLGTYELGSVIYPLIIAIGLDTQTIDVNNSYSIEDHSVNGFFNVYEIFNNTYNVGMVQIAKDIGQHNIKDYFKLLGLNKQLKIELPERARPYYPIQLQWSDTILSTISYGYGISISPLHLVQAMIPVVNGGYWHSLTLVKRREQESPRQILATETSQEINNLLRNAVTNGASRLADVNGYLVGGKTGTAKKIKDRKYNNNSVRSSFIGIFPSTAPKYIIYIMLDEPKDNDYSAIIADYSAAPTTSRIISRIIGLQGILPHYKINDTVNITGKINGRS